MGELRSFDLGGPLPVGANALEASAGTGKTFALSSLAVRYIAELSLHPSQLCLVSFTDAATAELRGRVRTRLVEAVRHCQRLLHTPSDTHIADPVLAAIASPTTDPARVSRRLHNLQVAVAEFDAATISTIHGFCQRVLISAGQADEIRAITEGSEDIAEVVHDLLLAVAASPGDFGFLDREPLGQHNLPDRLITAVSTALGMPDATWFQGDIDSGRSVHPSRYAGHALTGLMIGLVDRAVAEVLTRRRQRAHSTFDGIISATRDHLRSEAGVTTIGALRERFAVVLIDEFQDTDSVQWDIFRMAFIADAQRGPLPAICIVGDPKQSIYRFRSAEISAYLAAVSTAGDQVSTLDTNWRSDGNLLDALENLMDGFTFGEDQVRFHPVRTAPDLGGTRLGGTDRTALEIRAISGADRVPVARAAIRNDLVGVVADHLTSEMTIRARTPDADGRYSTRRVRPSDIAILTRSNNEAASVALALSAAGIPATTASSQSVLDSEAAHQWRVLFEAISAPHAGGLARAAALGWFIGLSARELVEMDDEAMAIVQDRLREWGRLLEDRGVPGLVQRARAEGLQARLLAGPTGERDLTDLDHVAEILQGLSGGRPVSAATCAGLLAQAAARVEEEGHARDVLARRIDRDDHAVTVMTVHKSKGLEFPILLLPFMWAAPSASRGVPHGVYEGTRHLDATWIANLGPSKLNEPVRALNAAESAHEARRLLYVALTRARHRCVVWWAGGSDKSPLAELFEHRLGQRVQSHVDLAPLVSSAPGLISVTPVPASVGTTAIAPQVGVDADTAASALAVREVTRTLDEAWRIWSFTGITSLARARAEQFDSVDHGPRITHRAEVIGGAGEDEEVITAHRNASDVDGIDAVGVTTSDESAAVDSGPTGVLLSAPAGPVFGTLVHEVLEHVNFTADDLREQLRVECAARLAYRPMDVSPEDLAIGLEHAICSPLGGPLGAMRLRDLSSHDRLDELDFALPLGRLSAADLGTTLAATLAPDDPFRAWAEARSGGGAQTAGFDLDMEGRLIGSIDLTLRQADAHTGQMRYWVADYKSNLLPTSGPVTSEVLIEAMVHHDYPLQAILYLVALHRYLRWRVPGYQIATHLGGAAYLFLRAMNPGADPSEATGVVWWTPAPEAVRAVDRLLSGAGVDDERLRA